MTTEQQIGALRAEVDNIKEDVSEIKGDVREVRDILLKAQGGWRTLVIFGSVSVAIGASLTKIVSWLLTFLPK